MARIPRNERFVDFQPSAPVLTPLSLGDTSGFASALMGGAKTVAQEHTNRKNAEDEVALRKFNQNLLNHESEALTSLENTPTVDGVALPHRDYRQFTEENFEEFIPSALGEDPALQNLSPKNQARLDSSIVEARGRVGRKADRQSAKVLQDELRGFEKENISFLLEQVGIAENPALVVNDIESFFRGFKARVKDGRQPAFTLEQVEALRFGTVTAAKANLLARYKGDMVQSLMDPEFHENNPDIPTIEDIKSSILKGEFDEIVDFKKGGRAALATDLETTVLTAKKKLDAQNREGARFAAIKEYVNVLADDSANKEISSDRVQALLKQMLNTDMRASDVKSIADSLVKFQTDPTVPSEKEKQRMFLISNKLGVLETNAKITGIPVSRKQLQELLTDPNNGFLHLHPSDQNKFLKEIDEAADGLNSSFNAAVTSIQKSIAKHLGHRVDDRGTFEKGRYAFEAPGSGHFPEIAGNLEFLLNDTVKDHVKRWSKAHPKAEIDEAAVFNEIISFIKKGKFHDAAKIDIPENDLENVYFKSLTGVKLNDREELISDLAVIRLQRMQPIVEKRDFMVKLRDNPDSPDLQALAKKRGYDISNYEQFIEHAGRYLEPRDFVFQDVIDRVIAKVRIANNKQEGPSVPVPIVPPSERFREVPPPVASPSEVPPASSPAVPIEPHWPLRRNSDEPQAIEKREVPSASSPAVPIEPHESQAIEKMEVTSASPREVPSPSSPAVPIPKSLREMKEIVKSIVPNVFPRTPPRMPDEQGTPPRMSDEQVRASEEYKEATQAENEKLKRELENVEISVNIAATEFKERFSHNPAIVAVADHHLAEMAKAMESYDWEAYADELDLLKEFIENTIEGVE